jgi:hypothetical protein
VVVQTRGFAHDSFTAEDIAANLDAIMDPIGAAVADGSGTDGRPTKA